MTAISVIIPVYNAQSHLKECIESLLSQSFSDCEFIFVNDGSTDQSQNILEVFALSDARIKIIHQNNQGVSAARNNGLNLATGMYIGFVDADDYIASDFFEKLYQTATINNLDVVLCNYKYQIEHQEYHSDFPFLKNELLDQSYIQKEVMPYLIGHENLNAIWNKLYRSTIIKENTIQFPEGVALGEDGWFNLLFFSKAKRLLYLDYSGYFYREVEGSATRDFESKNYFKRINEDFIQDYSTFQNTQLSLEAIAFLKAQKFIKKVMGLLYEYNDHNAKLSTVQKKIKVNEILNHPTTKKILESYYNVLILQKSKYEKTLIFAIKYRSNFMINGLIAYSKFRNKKR